ncbi:hypothetical protein CICLE_v10006983mg, partial [Citrus x clementina]
MGVTVVDQQPEECISHGISFTTPRDACRSSLIPWVKFLPSDYKEIIFSSVSDSSLITTLSKKDLYFYLYHHLVFIINDSRVTIIVLSFNRVLRWRRLVVGARGLFIAWEGTSNYWKWTSLPKS